MTGLSDLISLPRSVSIGGKEIEIFGLTFEQIGKLLARFESLRSQITTGAASADKVDANSLVARIGSDAASAIIAVGIGKPDDKEQEVLAAKLAFGTQVDLIDGILKATLPSGDGPLAQKLAEFGRGLSAVLVKLTEALNATSSSPPPPSSDLDSPEPKSSP